MEKTLPFLIFVRNLFKVRPGICLKCKITFCTIFILDQLPAQTLTELKKLSVEELMNIEVTSVSKRPEKLAEVASAIQVITYEDIRRSGVTSVPEALRLAPNLQVAQVNASQWAISARGFNNVLANKLLVLIDGRVVYTPMYAGVFWDVQNLLLEDIDRIEVISGPGGSLWGANAVNGVINIITKSSKETKGLFAEIARGTELPGLASLRYGGTISQNLSYRIYGTAFKRDNTILNDSVDANDNWTMGQTGLRLDWDAKKNDRVTVQSNFYSDRPDPDGGKPVIASGDNIISRWNHIISDKSNFQLQAYYDKTWRDFRNGFAEKLRTYDLDGQHRFQLGKYQEVIWGLGIRLMEHDVENLELFAFLPASKRLHIYSTFVQDEIKLVKDYVRLTIGSKFEHNNYTGFQYQPNGRLTWTPTQHQTLWAAISRAVRTPSRIDREFFLSINPQTPFIVGSESKSEKLLAYELGWRLQLQPNASLSLSTFYNIYDDIRSVEPGAQTYPVTFGNGVKGDTYGVELSTVYQIKDWWRLRGGYTFLKKSLSVKSTSGDLNKGTAESDDPEHQCLLQSYVDLPGGIELGTVFRYVAKLPKPAVPGYAQLDVRLAWKVNKIIELNVVGQNLLESSHAEFIPSSPSPRQIERSVYGKIICRLN